jgi:replication factor A1
MKSKKPTLEDQLAFIATQNEVFPTELFQALIDAKEDGNPANIAGLNAEYRGSINNQAIFLITKGTKVVAQFRVPEEMLTRTDISFDSAMDTNKVRKEIAKQNPPPSHIKIANLRVGMKKINVTAEVLQTTEPAKVHTQFRDNAIVSNAAVGDETGKVLLCLWDQQIDSVHTGDYIEIKNAHVAMFKGEKQLRLGKNGTITILERPLES